MIWDELTSPRLASLDRHIPVILPVAATEQHGPHLPLSTDRLIGEYLLRQLNERLPNRILILPTSAVTCSEHHMDFAGTLTLTHTLFIQQVNATLESVVAHGFTNLIVANSHGGNIAAGQVAVEMFGRHHPGCQVMMFTWWQVAAEQLLKLNETGAGGVGHAGEFETSLMLLIAPHLVDMSAVEQGGNQSTYDWATHDMLRKPKVLLYRTMRDMTTNGIYGDPTTASKEKGEQIAAVVIEELEQIVASMTAVG